MDVQDKEEIIADYAEVSLKKLLDCVDEIMRNIPDGVSPSSFLLSVLAVAISIFINDGFETMSPQEKIDFRIRLVRVIEEECHKKISAYPGKDR